MNETPMKALLSEARCARHWAAHVHQSNGRTLKILSLPAQSVLEVSAESSQAGRLGCVLRVIPSGAAEGGEVEESPSS